MADNAANLREWSTTTSSNLPNDSTTIGSGLADVLQEIQGVVRRDLASVGANIASSANPDVGAVQGLYHTVTGNNTIAGLGSTATAGIWKFLEFAGTPPLIHSTALQLLGEATIQAAAGDVGAFFCVATNQWKMVSYGRDSISPHASASASAAGVVELATNAETLTGTDTTRAITPSALDSVLGLVKLATGTVAAATAVADVTMTGYTAYAHKMLIADLIPSTDGDGFEIQVSTDGGSTFDSAAGNYSYALHVIDDNGAFTVLGNVSWSAMPGSQGAQVGNGATEGISAKFVLFNTTSTAKWQKVIVDSTYLTVDATPRIAQIRGTAVRRAAQDTDAVRLRFVTGTIASGTWALYGFNT